MPNEIQQYGAPVAALGNRISGVMMSYSDVQSVSEVIFNSRLYPSDWNKNSPSYEEVISKIQVIVMTAVELQLPPMMSITTLNVIKGKVTIPPQAMLALIYRSGLLKDIKITGDATYAEVTMWRKGVDSPYTFRFTIENARAMGVGNNDNYAKQAWVMLKWRAVAGCARVLFADVILGLYLPDEMGMNVTYSDSGEIIEGTAQEVPADEVPAPPKPQLLDTRSENERFADNLVQNGNVPTGEPVGSDKRGEADRKRFADQAAALQSQNGSDDKPDVSQYTVEGFKKDMAERGYTTAEEIREVMVYLGLGTNYKPDKHAFFLAQVDAFIEREGGAEEGEFEEAADDEEEEADENLSGVNFNEDDDEEDDEDEDDDEVESLLSGDSGEDGDFNFEPVGSA